ncbi:von Willebrand factor type A domain-containing protein [Aquimarina hainanensis]|uniref:von Willebrand factor type A domain-containing protein n=1 Tax=Aquimarina hainanensis TaxID=1578017 RepID=A0ABW5NAT2_9FLAO
MRYLLLCLLYSFCFLLQAQTPRLNGIVTDENGLPLPGVSIINTRTNQGSTTDFDGYFTALASLGDTLSFSYIGYVYEELIVSDLYKTINVILKEDNEELEEVVITGYATGSYRNRAPSRVQRKKRVNSRLTFQKKEKTTSKGGNPAVYPSKKQPLYIVDGNVIPAQAISCVLGMNKNRISKQKKYKRGEAQAIFGKQARYGCVVITTHSGTYRIEDEESYRKITENQFLQTVYDPLSTFSIDVDKASYSNIRKKINAGIPIPRDAVKIEEMVNYFAYDYPQPTGVHPFGIHTEYGRTPWNPESQLVKIGIKGKEMTKAAIPASNLVFLLDVSGSMDSPDKLQLLKKAFSLLVQQLREKDVISIVVYAGAAGLVLPPTSGAYKQQIIQALDGLEAGGSTAGGEGIELAYRIAEENFIKGGNNRVILATDGDFNVGMHSDQAMETLITEKRNSGVFLTCLGFGMGNYKDSKLEILADTGNGNHAYIDSMQEARKVLGDEFGSTLYTIAKDVKIQVEFNPEHVQAYRLIGYENRLLADEDFIDDTKDAGELGSGHTVTALYEIIPKGEQHPWVRPVPELKYRKEEGITNSTDELLTIRFRYKNPSEHKSRELTHVVQLSETSTPSVDFHFAASVAWYGMLLRKSMLLPNKNLDAIASLAAANRGEDRLGYRAEFIRLVRSYPVIH